MIDFKQPYNRTDFLNFLWNDLLPEDFVKCEDEISFAAEYTRKVTFLGYSESLELVVFEVRHNSKQDARVSLSKEAFRLLLRNSTKNKALILFVPLDNPNTYRFSLVTIDVEIDENKVSKSYSNPRRYSFKLGTDAMVETPKRYLATKADERKEHVQKMQTCMKIAYASSIRPLKLKLLTYENKNRKSYINPICYSNWCCINMGYEQIY
jgi:adenine-specific DNA-methyltransferase